MQPYIAAMQLLALVLLLSHNGISREAVVDLALGLPALAAGATLGVVLFRRIDDARFRRVVLAVLLFAGMLLVA